MEIVGFNGTAVTALFNLARREGAPPIVESAREAVERYKFAQPPKLEALFSDKIVFQNGVFQGTPIDAFEIYPDGIIVRGRCDSDVIDAFIDDAVGWFAGKTGAKRVETHRVGKNYESNLTVIGSDAMLRALAPLENVCRAVSAHLESATRSKAEFQPLGFVLAADDTKIPGLRPTHFRLERKVGVEFERNFFISIAPLKTEDHIRVLEALER